MGESAVNGVAEEVKVVNADWENVGEGLDSNDVNHVMDCCDSGENAADEDGKECGENGIESKRGRKKMRLCEKEQISGSKVEFVGRDLLSRSASTAESSKIGCEVDMVVGDTESLDKSSKLMKTDNDDSDVELETRVKRRRGRPPRVNVGSETTESNVAVVNKALDDCFNVMKASGDDSDILQVTTVKRKRGRPPKVNVRSETMESDVDIVTKALNENLHVVKANSEDLDCLQVTTVKRKRGRPPKVNERSETMVPDVDVGTKELDESLNAVKANSEDSDVVQVTTVKRKRGRPPKVNVGSETTEPKIAVPTKALDKSLNKAKANSDDSGIVPVTTEKRARGRPFKLKEKSAVTVSEVAVVVRVKGRCGRTSMKRKIEAIDTNHSVLKTVAEKKKKKPGRCPISKPGLKAMMRQPKSHGQRRFLKIQSNSRGRKVLNNLQGMSYGPHLKRLTSPSENKNLDFVNGDYGSPSRTNLVQTRENGEEKPKGCGKSMEKHLLREQIKDMLLSAGWTIEYRPRMGREYADAVYVSSQGRAYWSVTRAYSVLKSHNENIDAASPKVNPGFTFRPIPENEMKLLARETKKKKESLAKLGLHASDTGNKNNKKSRETKQCMRNAGGSHGTQSQNFVVESNGKASRGKSKNAQSKRRRALLVRDSKKGMDGSGTFNLYHGKRMVLNWMIDLGTVPLDADVHYRGAHQRTRRIHAGRIVRDGISCGCCNEVVTLSEFQVHGRGKSDYPSQYIYLEDGTSLLQCQRLTWDKQGDSQCKGFHSLSVTGDDPNDDSCGICGNGGELICCDGCTSTFHLDCLNLSKYPSGEWHCLYCSCKFCGQVGGGSCQGNIDGLETSMMATCHLCEAKYHKLCIQTDHAADDAFDFASFCGKDCQEVLNKLMPLVGVKNELADGYSWILLHRFDVGSDSDHSEMPLKVECNSKLAVALSIMDECFLPIVDHRTGIDLIHNVVYNCGSNFTRLNYSGFYTVILEKGDELISAASIRVHGDGLAEMPFIGTRHNYRRQGMCSRLLGAVEDALRSLGVKKLVIPAISELLQTWTSVFGFKPLRADERQKLKNVNLLVFPCTDMLQKTISETDKEQEIILPIDAAGKHDNLDTRSFDEPETSSCNEGVSHLKKNMEDRDFGSQRDGFCGNGNLSVEATAQIAEKCHEIPPCNTAVSETSQATLSTH